MPSGVQKNVRLSEQSSECLRALKYDLDSSDGEVIAQALESLALGRLQLHAALLRRAELGLLPPSRVPADRTSAAVLMAALNSNEEHYRLRGAIETLGADGVWRPGIAAFDPAAQKVASRAVQRAEEMGLPQVSVAVLLLVCCESPDAARFQGLGIPVSELADRLREALQARSVGGDPQPTPFSATAKSVLMEGCIGVAALEGVRTVNVEHILVAALQKADEDGTADLLCDLQIDADLIRGTLVSGRSHSRDAGVRGVGQEDADGRRPAGR